MIKGGLRSVVSPNYPIAPNQYSRQFMDQFINILRLNTNTFANAINAPKVFASYYSDLQQTNAGAAVVNKLTYNNVIVSYGTTLDSPGSRIYVAESGIYNIQFSAQLDRTGAGAPSEVYIWIRLNGIDVPYSAGKVVLQSANAETVAAWNYVLLLPANGYVEIAWSSTDTTVLIQNAVPATGPPAIPGIPSVIATVCWVSNIPA